MATSPAAYQYRISSHTPWRSALLGLGLVAAAAAISYAFHLRELARVEERADLLAMRLAALERTNADLRERSQRLAERNAVVERARQVDTDAYGRVGERLRELQSERLRLQRELAFYRDIVEPASGDVVAVRQFMLSADDPGSWRYEFVLTRGRNDGKVIAGTVTLEVEGEQGAASRSLSMAEAGGGEPIGFEFRYFQRIEGRLALPSGFVPRKVSVRVSLGGGRHGRFEKRFDWPVAAG